MKEERDWLDIISWIMMIGGATIYFIWVIGKMTGLIHSPVWIEYLPHFVGGITLLGATVKAGKLIEKVNSIDKKVISIEHSLGIVKEDIVDIKIKVSHLNIGISKLDSRIFRLEK